MIDALKMATLSAEVAEIVRGYQLDHVDWSSMPEPGSALEWSVKSLGRVISRIVSGSKESSSERAALLAQLIDAGLSPDARFGGTQVNGVNVSADGKGRSSLLMLCMMYGFYEGVDLLLRRGADPLFATADHGFTLVDQAVTNLDVRSLRRVLDAAPYEAYMVSGPVVTWPANFVGAVTASWADPEAVRALVSVLFENGMTREEVLTKIVLGGRDCPWIVGVLVDLGCDPFEGNNAPAIAAASGGKRAMLQQLLERGVDPNWRSEKGVTLVRYGAKHREIKNLLRGWQTQRAVADSVRCDTSVVKLHSKLPDPL